MKGDAHHAMSKRLAAHLRKQGYRAWIEAQRVGKYSYGDSPRVDVLAFRPWTGKVNFEMIAFEVKVSVNDLKRDLAVGKWRNYAAILGVPRVVVACPEGMTKLADLPADLGLFTERKDGTWHRHRLGRPLEGDQRKIDPLLLLWCLSCDGDETSTQWVTEKTRGLRQWESLPEIIRNAIKKEFIDVPSYAYREIVERLSRKHGANVARRFAEIARGPDKTKERVEAWAMTIVTAAAGIVGSDPGTIVAEIAEYGRLATEVEHAIRFAWRMRAAEKRVVAIAEGLHHLAYGWDGFEQHVDAAVAAAQARDGAA